MFFTSQMSDIYQVNLLLGAPSRSSYAMPHDLLQFVGDSFKKKDYEEMLEKLSVEETDLNVVPGSGYIRDTGLTKTWALRHPDHPRVFVALVSGKYIVNVKAGSGVFIKPHELPQEIKTYKQLNEYLAQFL